MTSTVMQLLGMPDGSPTPYDGQYLKHFDFEAYNGVGLISMTPDLSEAKKFMDIGEALQYYRTSPKCRPLREDGKPNRPLTATNWTFQQADQ